MKLVTLQWECSGKRKPVFFKKEYNSIVNIVSTLAKYYNYVGEEKNHIRFSR